MPRVQARAVKRALVLSLLAAGVVARAEVKPGAPAPATIERVTAVVNDDVILESEVVQRATPLMADVQATDPETRAREWKQLLRKTAEQMIDEELIVEAAVEAKLEVTDEDVQKAVDEIKRQ